MKALIALAAVTTFVLVFARPVFLIPLALGLMIGRVR